MFENLLNSAEVITINKAGQRGINIQMGGTDTDRSNICPLIQSQYDNNPSENGRVINALCLQRRVDSN